MSASTSTWDRRKAELELPEEVDLQVELANAGSRTLAILADIMIGLLVLFVVYSLWELLAHDMAEDWLTKTSSSVIKIVLILLIFGFQWCYFNLFEWLWNGQTPGKRMMHLRVIKVDGSPVSGIDVLLRNISRPVDTLGPMGLIGLLMIFVNRKAQRLGDLMARTLVIHEAAIDWSIFDEVPGAGAQAKNAPAPPHIHLNATQWELLHRYLNRRTGFDFEVRERLARILYDALKKAARGSDLERSTLAPEEWLLELARRS
jgi:uncharacterized RDD family membrane protein YckC